MKVLLLGVGMQGKAALHDLVNSPAVDKIFAADREFEALQAHVTSKKYGSKVRCDYVDAADPESIDHLMRQGPDVVIDDVDTPEMGMWLRRDELQGRDIDTAGGTKVGTVGDFLLDEEANIVGFALAKVHVEGPVAEKRMVVKQAVIETGGKSGIITVDLTMAEQLETDTPPSPADTKEEEALASEEPAEIESGEDSEEGSENDAESPSEPEN